MLELFWLQLHHSNGTIHLEVQLWWNLSIMLRFHIQFHTAGNTSACRGLLPHDAERDTQLLFLNGAHLNIHTLHQKHILWSDDVRGE